MSRKLVLALTAIAALGITALTPTSASAFGHFGGGGHSMGRMSMGHVSVSRGASFNRSFSRSSSMHRVVNHGPRINRTHINNHAFNKFNRTRHPQHAFWWKHHHHHHQHAWWWWRHHHRPYWVYPVVGETVVEGAAPVAAAPVAAAPVSVAAVARDNCTCLTKTYLDDGSVMFKDVCTKEAAVAPPAEAAPGQ